MLSRRLAATDSRAPGVHTLPPPRARACDKEGGPRALFQFSRDKAFTLSASNNSAIPGTCVASTVAAPSGGSPPGMPPGVGSALAGCSALKVGPPASNRSSRLSWAGPNNGATTPAVNGGHAPALPGGDASTWVGPTVRARFLAGIMSATDEHVDAWFDLTQREHGRALSHLARKLRHVVQEFLRTCAD